MHRAKTGNSNDIQRIEEKCLKVQKLVEERARSCRNRKWWIWLGRWKSSTAEHKQHVRDLIKHVTGCIQLRHTRKHPAAASILRLLTDEVDEQTYVALLNVGTRPLIMMEMPQMTMQALEMKLEREQQEKAENLCNQPIRQIIEEQNVPVLVEQWLSSSIMLPRQYLAAMVYYFVYAEANPDQSM